MDLFKKMQLNAKKNGWWLKLFRKPLEACLRTCGFTPQAIGVFFNVYTSNKERWQMVRVFRALGKKE
jgi:hypothetical protein